MVGGSKVVTGISQWNWVMAVAKLSRLVAQWTERLGLMGGDGKLVEGTSRSKVWAEVEGGKVGGSQHRMLPWEKRARQ